MPSMASGERYLTFKGVPVRTQRYDKNEASINTDFISRGLPALGCQFPLSASVPLPASAFSNTSSALLSPKLTYRYSTQLCKELKQGPLRVQSTDCLEWED